ncbi:MAG: DUF5667 domain-containing protein [Chloroflexota bacterium]
MMKTNLFDALEICLQALDKGADLESCLALFPEFVDDLRPILTAAVQAHSAVVKEVPAEVISRGKARVLQAAAEMREQRAAALVATSSSKRSKGFFGPRFFRLALTTATMLVFLLTSGTGLVNASSSALPGDNLYPVKRSWEDVRLFFVFDENSKEQLSEEFDHKRVQEIEELYSEKRVAEVDFHGVVGSMTNDVWVIGGLNIAIDPETQLSSNILNGSTVHITGETDDGVIKAGQIVLVATPGVTPTAGFDDTLEPTVGPEASETPESTEVSDGENKRQTDENPVISTPTRQPKDQPEVNPTETRKPSDDKPKDDNTNQNNNDSNDNSDNHNSNDKSDNENSNESQNNNESQNSNDS